MKKIEIEIPEGKEVQWIGDTLKLVDIKKPVTERIKTFEDACKELGNHPFVKEYALINPFTNFYSKDLIAYLKLRIITAALNEALKISEQGYNVTSILGISNPEADMVIGKYLIAYRKRV